VSEKSYAMVPTIVLIPEPVLPAMAEQLDRLEAQHPGVERLWEHDVARKNGWNRESMLAGLLLAQYVNMLKAVDL